MSVTFAGGLLSTDSASTPPQPASPVCCCQARQMPSCALQLRNAPPGGKNFWLTVPCGLHEAGQSQQRCRAGGNQLRRLDRDVMRKFVRPLAIVQPGGGNPRKDMIGLAGHRNPQMRIDDRVQRRLRILRGKHLAVAAQGLQPRGKLGRHPLCLDDRAEPSTAGLEPARGRGMESTLGSRVRPFGVQGKRLSGPAFARCFVSASAVATC